MAHHRSAKKRILQTAKRTEVNRNRISRIRSAVRKVEEAISRKEKDEAQKCFRQAVSLLARGVQRGVIKRNAASRKISRLSGHFKSMSF